MRLQMNFVQLGNWAGGFGDLFMHFAGENPGRAGPGCRRDRPGRNRRFGPAPAAKTVQNKQKKESILSKFKQCWTKRTNSGDKLWPDCHLKSGAGFGILYSQRSRS